MAVVENLEDMWLISKLQRDRKAKEEEEKQKKLQVPRAPACRLQRQCTVAAAGLIRQSSGMRPTLVFVRIAHSTPASCPVLL